MKLLPVKEVIKEQNANILFPVLLLSFGKENSMKQWKVFQSSVEVNPRAIGKLIKF